MAKKRTNFVCQTCGYQMPKWQGKCPACLAFNTFVEELEVATCSTEPKNLRATGKKSKVQKLAEVDLSNQSRRLVGIGELDRVLGGGIVESSLILVGGDPGIGKSTLLLQVAAALVQRHGKVLYIPGEESERQLKLRAERMGVHADELYVVAEINLQSIISHITEMKPEFVIIDSVQTIFDEEFSAAPGSVTQVRECTGKLMRIAKEDGPSIFLVGHVTKDGNIAGPKVLEHMVDTVLYLEGEKNQLFRILRSVKNRFGSTNEIGVFEMVERGLVEVENPSQLFLGERPAGASGAVAFAAMEGTRPLLLEMQALVTSTVFGNPRRLATGIDLMRLNLLIAVMEKRFGFPLGNRDVYVNIAGGVKIDDRSADLAVCLSIASSFRNIPIPQDTLVFGEVGLSGELRAVAQSEKRILEAAKLGFKKCILPKNCSLPAKTKLPMEIIKVEKLEQALTATFSKQEQ